MRLLKIRISVLRTHPNPFPPLTMRIQKEQDARFLSIKEACFHTEKKLP